MRNRRTIIDNILKSITYFFSSFGVIILAILLIFIFSKGFKHLSFKMLTSDYNETQYLVNMDEGNYNLGNFKDPQKKDVYFSTNWGVGFSEKKSSDNELIVYVSYIDKESPLKNLKVRTDLTSYVSIKLDQKINKAVLTNEDNDFIAVFSKSGAKEVALGFEKGTIINDMILSEGGGGIRGSLITTFYLIILTLIIALPLGIGGAVYLHEYAKDNRFTKILRTMIEMTSGIPSIIFGLVGVIVFIPIMNTVVGSDGGSIASGALTLSIILLPVIIRTTEEALKVIPDSYRQASLALGASKTQTIFKVVIPNALNGILTSVILSIGRIIGESAALIYAIGTTIKDQVSISERSTSLAVHIWVLMGGDKNSYDLSCAISIIILIMVFILSISAKLISKRFNRFEVKA